MSSHAAVEGRSVILMIMVEAQLVILREWDVS